MTYKAELIAETVPMQSSDMPISQLISIKGPSYVEPFIETIIQCEGSTATTKEINELFRMEEILVEETMSKIGLDFDKLMDNVDEQDPDKN